MGESVRKVILVIAVLSVTTIVASSALSAEHSAQADSGSLTGSEASQAQVDSLRQRLFELEAEIIALHYLLHEDTAIAGVYATLDDPLFPDRTTSTVSDSPAEASGAFQVESFFELLGSRSGSDDDQRDFQLANAEVAVGREMGERLSLNIAVAYNSDDEVFELGSAEVSAIIYEHEDRFVTSLSLTAGQFDVPFGIDYMEASPPDRRLITAPIVVEGTHDYWNEVGAHLDLTGRYGNLSVFAVDGLSTSFEFSAPEADVYSADVNPAQVYGARLGIAPLQAFEIGGSLAAGMSSSWNNEMTMSAVDLQVYLAALEIKGEFIAHSFDIASGSVDNSGYYFQAGYDMADFRLTARYGSFEPDHADRLQRYSLGIGYVLSNGIEGRVETQFQEHRSAYGFVQLIAAF